jgi:hypothetical protein
MALQKSHRPFPKSSELQIVCRLAQRFKLNTVAAVHENR